MLKFTKRIDRAIESSLLGLERKVWRLTIGPDHYRGRLQGEFKESVGELHSVVNNQSINSNSRELINERMHIDWE